MSSTTCFTKGHSTRIAPPFLEKSAGDTKRFELRILFAGLLFVLLFGLFAVPVAAADNLDADDLRLRVLSADSSHLYSIDQGEVYSIYHPIIFGIDVINTDTIVLSENLVVDIKITTPINTVVLYSEIFNRNIWISSSTSYADLGASYSDAFVSYYQHSYLRDTYGLGTYSAQIVQADTNTPLSNIVSFTLVNPSSTIPFSGDGKEESPYLIQSASDLATLSELVSDGHTFESTYFLVTRNIDLSEYSSWKSIGDFLYHLAYQDIDSLNTDEWDKTVYTTLRLPFCGIFDGGNHEISGLNLNFDSHVENHSMVFSGLFGYVNNGAILKNIVISDVSTNVNSALLCHYSGALVGGIFADYGDVVVDNCRVDGTYSAYGGLIGLTSTVAGTVTLNNCYSSVSGDTNGGLIGYAETHDGGTITVSKSGTTILDTIEPEHYSTGNLIGTITLSNPDGSGNSPIQIIDCFAEGKDDSQYLIYYPTGTIHEDIISYSYTSVNNQVTIYHTGYLDSEENPVDASTQQYYKEKGWNFDTVWKMDSSVSPYPILQQISTSEPVEEYTITFDSNGGTGSMGSANVSAGESYTLPECTFTAPDGQVFKAWLIGSTEYAAGTSYTPTASVTVKAVWTVEDTTAPGIFTINPLENGIVSWTVSEGATGYKFSLRDRTISETEDTGKKVNNEDVGTATNYDISSYLVEGHSYRVAVCAYNDAGKETWVELEFVFGNCQHTNLVDVDITYNGITKDFPQDSGDGTHYWYVNVVCDDCKEVQQENVKRNAEHNAIVNGDIPGVCECNYYPTEWIRGEIEYMQEDADTYLIPEANSAYKGGSLNKGEQYSILSAENLGGYKDWNLIEYSVSGTDRTKIRFVKATVKTDVIVPISFRASDEGVIKYQFSYSDSYFTSPSTEYNHDLAKISLGLAAASFTHPAADIDGYDGYSEALEKLRITNIKDAYANLGFDNAEYYNYDVPVSDSSNKVAYSIAKKDIDNDYVLYVVVPRGGGYGGEWASNFEIGLGDHSTGFKKPADEIFKTVKSLLSREDDLSKVKIWVTGFGRGAAVANILGSQITGSSELGLTKENIYVYTFATPNNVIPKKDTDIHSSYNNIYNIVNPSDFVPTFPLNLWGYDRYGTTYYFNYDETLYSSVEDTYRHITGGLTYKPEDLSFSVGYLDARLSQIFDDRETYATVHEKYIRTLLEVLFDDNTNELKFSNIILLNDKLSGYPGGKEAINAAKKVDLRDDAATVRKSISLLFDDFTESLQNTMEMFYVLLGLISTLDDVTDLTDEYEKLAKDVGAISKVVETDGPSIIDIVKYFERDDIDNGDISLEIIASELKDYVAAGFTGKVWEKVRDDLIHRSISLTRNLIEIWFSEIVCEGFVSIGYLNGLDVEDSINEFYNTAELLYVFMTLIDLGSPINQLFEQHQPEIYMAWLLSDEPESKIYTTLNVYDPTYWGYEKIYVNVETEGKGSAYGPQTVFVKSGSKTQIKLVAVERYESDFYGPIPPETSFIGWYDDNGVFLSDEHVLTTSIKRDSTFHARFGSKITYNLNGGVNHPENPMGYLSSDEDIIIEQPTKEDYEFRGWNIKGSSEIVSRPIIPQGSYGDVEYTALWIAKRETFNSQVTLDNDMIESIELPGIKDGETITIMDSVVSFSPESPKYFNTLWEFEITLGSPFVTDEDCTIFFSIEPEELPSSVKPDDIFMYHLVDGTWVKLDTIYLCQLDTGTHMYKATTSSFSPFAIGYDITTPPLPDTDSMLGNSKNTGSGNYAEYPRSVTNGGYVDFGTSPVVKGVTLPEGVSGKVVLIAKSETTAPEGKEAYGVFEINVASYPTGEKSVISFTIPLSDLQKKGFTEKDICLYHFDGDVWTKLPTTYTVEGDKVFYQAETTAFSPFAIVYEKDGATSAAVSEIPVEPENPSDEPVSTVPEIPSSSEPQETESPAPVLGMMLGGLGAAVLMRRK